MKNQLDIFKGEVEFRRTKMLVNLMKFINKILKFRLLKRLKMKEKIFLTKVIKAQSLVRRWIKRKKLIIIKHNSSYLKGIIRRFLKRIKIRRIILIQKYVRRLYSFVFTTLDW